MNKPRKTRIAAYGLVLDGQRILLCRLSKQVARWQGYWTLPGGRIEFGESPEEAMIREVEEETGLVVLAKSLETIDSFTDLSREEDHHGIRIIYNAEVVDGELRDEVDGSTDTCAWHDLESIRNIKLVRLARIGLKRINVNARS